MVFHPNPPSERPALIEALAVWGWAVAHGGIPLDYAAQALADHPSYMKHTGVPDPTEFERRTWAAEDLTNWEDVVARMAWPGDKAVDEERWDEAPDWRMREYLLRRLGLSDSHESTPGSCCATATSGSPNASASSTKSPTPPPPRGSDMTDTRTPDARAADGNLPVYGRKEVPGHLQHLRTTTELKSQRLKPADGQQPVALLRVYRSGHGWGEFPLYDPGQAAKMRPLSARQRAAMTARRTWPGMQGYERQ